MKLVRPTKKYEKQWRMAVEEFRKDSKTTKLWEVLGDPDDLAGCIRTAKNHTRGIDLPVDWVPYDIYWLIDNDEFVGIISIRHKLNDNLSAVGGHIGAEIVPSKRGLGYANKARELVLPKLVKLGLKRILMTSFDGNIASWKVIEKNNGKLENKIKADGENDLTRRYWIDL
jgi:predicted acetyltransferase